MLYWNAYHDKQEKLNYSTGIKNQSDFHKNFMATTGGVVIL